MFTLPFHPKNKSPAPPTPHPNGTATHDNGEPPEARAEAAAIVPTTMTLELRPKAPVQAAPTAGAIAPTTMTLELRPKVEDEPEEPAPRNDEEDDTNRKAASGPATAPTPVVRAPDAQKPHPLPARPAHAGIPVWVPSPVPVRWHPLLARRHPLPARPSTPPFLRGDAEDAPASLLSQFRHVINVRDAWFEPCAIPGYQHLMNVEACGVEQMARRVAEAARVERRGERRKEARERRKKKVRVRMERQARKERRAEREREAGDEMEM